MRIVSIDFNTIMYPCIKLYDHLINNPNENATMIWNAIEHEFEMERHLSFDKKVVMEIAKFIKEYRDDSEIIAIERPRDIIKYLNDIDEKFDIVHMGYYHNITENITDEFSELAIFHEYNDKNWLGYLIYNNMLESMKWIKCPNSAFSAEEVQSLVESYVEFSIHPISFLNKLKNSDELITNEKLKIDRIVLCPNNLYVPYRYQYIFELICECFSIPMMIGG